MCSRRYSFTLHPEPVTGHIVGDPLVAQGMSSAEIAGYLFITEQTVKTHVSSILTKLGLRDRVQIVVFAYESGMVSPRA